jgi:nitroimidazol reductase NimA-like FMN-containing flavoprotein (pyridoxamine 5'-phosphate oxidase superfamily)
MADADLKAKILELLDEHRVMAIATNRADGWPQATIVGYVHLDLTI